MKEQQLGKPVNPVAQAHRQTLGICGCLLAVPVLLLLAMLTIALVTDSQSSKVVTASELGDAWPLVASEATVRVENDIDYLIEIDGVTYALNGMAMTRAKYPDLPWNLVLDDPRFPAIKKSIGPLIDAASEIAE